MKLIELACGRTALVDAEDVDLVNRFRWCKWGSYAAKVRGDGVHRPHYMQDLILPPPVGRCVDHANRNPLDNRRDNLRICTHSQNLANRILPLGVSGFRGVIRAGAGRWEARLTVQYKLIHLGRYDNPIQAAVVRDAAALHFFGEFAVLNFPAAGIVAALPPSGAVRLAKDRARQAPCPICGRLYALVGMRTHTTACAKRMHAIAS